jgi:uncharacterized protein YdaU (DUF1376 family)
LNYYERHIGDYVKDTAHLSMLEHGAYNLLMDRYYATEEPIPDEQKYRVARARTEDEKKAVEIVLDEFFELVNGRWIQKRCDEVLAEHHAFIEQQRLNGRSSAAKRALNRGSTIVANSSTTVEPPLSSGTNRTSTGSQPPTSHSPLSKNKRASKNGHAVPFPEDFALSDDLRSQALTKFPDCDPGEMFSQFRAHHEAHGKAMKSWAAAWTTWLGNASKFGYPKSKTEGGKWM